MKEVVSLVYIFLCLSLLNMRKEGLYTVRVDYSHAWKYNS
jgi:hypothetical protein